MKNDPLVTKFCQLALGGPVIMTHRVVVWLSGCGLWLCKPGISSHWGPGELLVVPQRPYSKKNGFHAPELLQFYIMDVSRPWNGEVYGINK